MIKKLSWRVETESLIWMNKILNSKSSHFHLCLTSYVRSHSRFPTELLLSLTDQRSLQSCLSAHKHTLLALISVTQRPGCSTSQPAGYWTCGAFPAPMIYSTNSLEAHCWGLIDYQNQSHKNDCIASQLSESINYSAVPADLNISSPSSISHPKVSSINVTTRQRFHSHKQSDTCYELYLCWDEHIVASRLGLLHDDFPLKDVEWLPLIDSKKIN